MIDSRDQLTREYFNARDIPISNGGFIAAAFPGMELDDEVIPLLTGAPDGSRIYVKKRKSGLYFEVRHDFFQRPLTWFLDKHHILHLFEFYLLATAPSGFGIRIMATSILTAQRLGLAEIQLVAFGKPDNGYYTWARLGFDAPLAQDEILRLERSGIRNVRSLARLMKTDAGPDWWRENGTGREMHFSLDEGSASVKALQQYLAKKGAIL